MILAKMMRKINKILEKEKDIQEVLFISHKDNLSRKIEKINLDYEVFLDANIRIDYVMMKQGDIIITEENILYELMLETKNYEEAVKIFNEMIETNQIIKVLVIEGK